MNFEWEAIKQVLAAMVRWSLQSVATFLITKGIIDPTLADAFLAQTTGIIVGLLVLGGVIVWKYLNARFNILSLIKAVQTEPPADTPKEIKAAVVEAQDAATQDPKLTVSF